METVVAAVTVDGGALINNATSPRPAVVGYGRVGSERHPHIITVLGVPTRQAVKRREAVRMGGCLSKPPAKRASRRFCTLLLAGVWPSLSARWMQSARGPEAVRVTGAAERDGDDVLLDLTDTHRDVNVLDDDDDRFAIMTWLAGRPTHDDVVVLRGKGWSFDHASDPDAERD